MGKWHVLAFVWLHPLFGGGGGVAVPFYSVQDCSIPSRGELKKKTPNGLMLRKLGISTGVLGHWLGKRLPWNLKESHQHLI